MISIYSFLQKRKVHENRHGIFMVIIAYALSFVMLVLGSDIFYNIDTAAEGIKKTGEETKDLSTTLSTTDTTDPKAMDYTLALLRTQMIDPYGLTETPKTKETQQTVETQTVSKNTTGTADTIWFLGNGMDSETFNNLMLHMDSLGTVKDDSLADTADLAAAADNAKQQASEAKDAKSGEAGGKKESGAKEKEEDTYSVRVASADKVITVTKKEVGMLERIVEAEAGGEDMIGKILIANVIFNRVAHDEFPDTVKGVIFENDDGDYQFSPVESGRYWDVKVSKETKKAVQRALKGEDYSEGALYFVAKKRSKKSGWFDSELEWLFKHGGHDFYIG